MSRNGSKVPAVMPERLPPHDMGAERAVLGCLLLDPLVAMPTAIQAINARPDLFYDLKHRVLWEILVEMYDAKEAIDLVTVSSWLSFQMKLDEVGGAAYLARLSGEVPSAANLTYYLAIIEDHYKSRQLLRICTEEAGKVWEGGVEPDQAIGTTANRILALVQESAPKNEESTIADLVDPAMEQIESWAQSSGTLTGIASGLTDLDRITTGFHPGEMIVIAGRPGSGKSSLAMNIVDHVAVDLGLPVGVFSLEMTRASLAVRLICARARVNLRHIQGGFLPERDMPKMVDAAAKLHSAKIYINDQSGLSILALRTRARRMAQQYGIKLIVIDYVQLMTAERNKNDSREREVAAISAGCKDLAKTLDLPVIALSQLNRTLERDKERRPRMSDLRESGSLEQDADFVGILWKPAQNNEADGYGDAIPVNLEICKQRSGPTGTVNLTFLRNYTKFESRAEVASEPEQEQYAAQQQQEFPT